MTKTIECTVFDLCADGTPRTHSLRLPDGGLKKFTFTDKGIGVPVPYEIAKTLIGNEGFEVQDQHGHVLKPLPKHMREEITELLVDECVAKFTDLTQEALIARAAKTGKTFKKNASRESIAEYLIARNIGAINADGGSFETIETEDADALEEEDAY